MSATPIADRLAAMTDAELIEAAALADYEAAGKGASMTAAQIVSVITAAAGLVTAVTALVHSIRTRGKIKPGQR